MTEPDTGPSGERTINIRKPYFDLIASGTKTVEVRVGYPSMRKITAGQVLRFACGDASLRARVTEVIVYPSFEAMVDAEDNTAIGGEGMTREELLAACRDIYPPEKESLGVLAIHLRLLPGQTLPTRNARRSRRSKAAAEAGGHGGSYPVSPPTVVSTFDTEVSVRRG